MRFKSPIKELKQVMRIWQKSQKPRIIKEKVKQKKKEQKQNKKKMKEKNNKEKEKLV